MSNITKSELAKKYGFNEFKNMKPQLLKDNRIVEAFEELNSDLLTTQRHHVRPNEHAIIVKYWGEPT